MFILLSNLIIYCIYIIHSDLFTKLYTFNKLLPSQSFEYVLCLCLNVSEAAKMAYLLPKLDNAIAMVSFLATSNTYKNPTGSKRSSHELYSCFKSALSLTYNIRLAKDPTVYRLVILTGTFS